ncbi:hypothetical protein, partial [Burkholderia cenocepacia]|uniref:hypothetical protein n=1 Tax=Burkholderia cenocepacia TaxID=95486 RepID=UPI0024B81ADB
AAALPVSSIASSTRNIVCFMRFSAGGDGRLHGPRIIEAKGKQVLRVPQAAPVYRGRMRWCPCLSP